MKSIGKWQSPEGFDITVFRNYEIILPDYQYSPIELIYTLDIYPSIISMIELNMNETECLRRIIITTSKFDPVNPNNIYFDSIYNEPIKNRLQIILQKPIEFLSYGGTIYIYLFSSCETFNIRLNNVIFYTKSSDNKTIVPSVPSVPEMCSSSYLVLFLITVIVILIIIIMRLSLQSQTKYRIILQPKN